MSKFREACLETDTSKSRRKQTCKVRIKSRKLAAHASSTAPVLSLPLPVSEGRLAKVKRAKKMKVGEVDAHVSREPQNELQKEQHMESNCQEECKRRPRKKKRRILEQPLGMKFTEEDVEDPLMAALRRSQARQMTAVVSRDCKRKSQIVVEDCERKNKRQSSLIADIRAPLVCPEVASASSYKKTHEIVVGAGCAEPMQTFQVAEEKLGAALTAALRAQGFSSPTPIQAQAWPVALQGDDVVAVAKTGSGKTCGFLLPALVKILAQGPKPLQSGLRRIARPSVLIIAPTRELAVQIFDTAQKFSEVVAARFVVIYGGVDKGKQVRELQAGADALVCTPGRLVDFMKGNPSQNLPPTISVEAVTYLVLDEADRMLDMGFEEDIHKVVDQCPKSGTSEEALSCTTRQTLFFTATWPKQVHKAAAAFTNPSAVQIRVGQGAGGTRLTSNPNVTQRVLVIQENEKLNKLKDVIRGTLRPGEAAIVFARRKTTCNDLAKELSWTSAPSEPAICTWCEAIHGDKDQWEREEILSSFRELTNGERGGNHKAVLVATDVASRGLDIPGVALVVIYDFCDPMLPPDSGVESYVHRIGRTGRAGKPGKAITFFTHRDLGAHKLAALLRDAGQVVPPALTEMAEAIKRSNAQRKSAKAKGSVIKGGYTGKGKSKGKWVKNKS